MEQAEHHAAQLVQLFADSQPLVADLDAKEGGHADELLVLAAASLISAADLSAASPSERSTKLFQVGVPDSSPMHLVNQHLTRISVRFMLCGCRTTPDTDPCAIHALWMWTSAIIGWINVPGFDDQAPCITELELNCVLLTSVCLMLHCSP